ncbi:MAG: response regulator, partial [Bacteroidota bacterium]
MTGRHTILVVEDNPATRKMVHFSLTRRGHRVIEAADGASAIELMEKEQPNLVLQDVILPDVDGFVLVAELRKRARGQVVILAFSGFTSRNDEARISAVGFDDVIIKPIEPSHLIQLVEAHLPLPDLTADRFGAGRRVVVADDDPVQLKLTRFRLEKVGFTVETAKDGREALEVLGRAPPDVIISDILMPNLDGFGLALAVRQHPALRKLPLLLMTSSYIEEADRDLARRAGASDVVPRTPEQREMIHALRALLAAPPPAWPTSADSLSEIENERTRRVVLQLERHVLMNAGLAQRCSALSAELAVLAGISAAVLKQQDIEAALDEALAACFDAGGISVGALYRLAPRGELNVRALGSKVSWRPGDVDSFFGQTALLHQIIAQGQTVMLPDSPGLPADAVRDVLQRAGANAVLIVPLIYLEKPIGALVMVAQAKELDQDDWRVFVQGVGNQIAQALALASAFEQREAAERLAIESRADWQALVENAPDTIMRIDREGVVRFVNHVPLPLKREALMGRPWLENVPSEYHEVLGQALQTVLSSGEPSSHEIVMPMADGANDWYSSRLAPIVTGGGITGAIVISQRITQKKQQEMQLIVSDRMASVGTLAAGVAHEINNPLAAVMANLELAHREAMELERTGNSSFVDYLQDAREAAERVRLIVRDLKVFSRAEEERVGPTDVSAVLESTLRMAWNEIRHRARVVKDFAELPRVEANESRLGQVFLNL